MSIHKFVLIVFWAIIWTWVPSMASTIPGNPAIRMALGVVGYLMNLRTILSENKLRMVQDMALDTEDWETPMSSPLHNCIFPVAINLKINKTFSRDVKAWFLIEPRKRFHLLSIPLQSLRHWNQDWTLSLIRIYNKIISCFFKIPSLSRHFDFC